MSQETPPENPTLDAPLVPQRMAPLWCLIFLAAVNLFGPFLPIPNLPIWIGGGIALTLAYIAAVIGFALGIARRKLSIERALIGLGVSALLWFGVEKGLWPLLRHARGEGAPSFALQMTALSAQTTQDLALFCGATFAGTILARMIRHPNLIGPIGAAIALIDIWGVLFGGIVSQLMTNKATQPLAKKAMSAGPQLGAATAAHTGFSISVPSIGVGDFLFIALLLSVLVNLSMNWEKSARLMWVLVCFALLSIQFLPFFPALPGLLFIGAAAVLPNWKYFTFTRDERFALLYAGIFVLILTIGLYFGFKAMLPHK